MAGQDLLVIGIWSLVIGHWSLVIGHWSFAEIFPSWAFAATYVKNDAFPAAPTMTLPDWADADYDIGRSASRIGCIRFVWRM
jgi:hypothetical protein